MRDVSELTGISLNKLYNSTNRDKLCNDFTAEEKSILYNTLFSNGRLSFEEVFERYEDTRFWNNAIPKSFTGR